MSGETGHFEGDNFVVEQKFTGHATLKIGEFRLPINFLINGLGFTIPIIEAEKAKILKTRYNPGDLLELGESGSNHWLRAT